MSKSSHGSTPRDRAWHLLKAIVVYASGDLDNPEKLRIGSKICWRDGDADSRQIIADGVTRRILSDLTKQVDPATGLSERQVLETLKEFKAFMQPVNLFTDNRASTQGGKGLWSFTLNLWFTTADELRYENFNQKWEECRGMHKGGESIPNASDAPADKAPQTNFTSELNSPDTTRNTSVTQSVTHNIGGTVIAVVHGSVNISSPPLTDPNL
jgi:hypothetical protein